MKAKAPYGTWRSFISASAVAESASRPGDVVVDGSTSTSASLVPTRRSRRNRQALGGSGGRSPEDVLPAPYSARSRVHEYGGGAFNVRAGCLVFVHDADQAALHARPG